MDLQAIQQPFGLGGRKGLVQGGWCVRIEVVHHHHHLARFRIVFFQHILPMIDKLSVCLAFRKHHDFLS